MLRLRTFFLLVLAALVLPAGALADASDRATPDWAFEGSDIPVDPAFRFGRLANGMRYVVRQNATPNGTAIVRMEVAAGSLDEAEEERGFAHFVEHMAFNGSTNIPEGEMVRLLERNGLAFGADTNAATGFEQTTYKLDLPRADPALLNIALMLMRETASELAFDPQAVERERGVVLAELRDRNNFEMRNALADTAFLHPGALYPRRFPIGVPETLQTASAEALKAFWRREYVPAHTTVIVIGDFDPSLAELAIRQHFDDWQAAPAEPQPSGGPVDVADRGRSAVYIDPALPERTMVSRHGRWLDEPDSIAQRQEDLLRGIGYDIVNRRLLSLSRLADPPFRGAGFGTGEVFKAGRTTRLVVDTVDGKWRRGVIAAALEYRKALKFGFTPGEVAEQVAIIRTNIENGAASAATRSHNVLANAVFELIRDGTVPADPQSMLERFEAFAPEITPERVLAAMMREAVPLKRPLLRLRGRAAPEGGEQALRSAWKEAMRTRLPKSAARTDTQFAYTDFGPPGTVVSDSSEPALGIRQVRFANGVMLNIRRTDIEKDRILVQLSLDGGDMLRTADDPLATEMVQTFAEGGLARHSRDELQSILAGRTVQGNLRASGESFIATARTTPRDLELQLQLLAAYLTSPGYRPEGEIQYWNRINNHFKQLRATPGAALSADIGRILSDGDPRYSLQDLDDYRKLTFARLQQTLADRLARGAIEIALVGDLDEDKAIALVAGTFGALPERESAFRLYEDQRRRPFTRDRGQHILRHTGPQDQALLYYSWPTRDDSDLAEALQLELLERVVRIELTDTLREKLGQAYAPGANSAPSRYWRGYGTFAVSASLDVRDLAAAREAIAETLARLREAPVSQDLLRRASEPMIEAHDNALKSNRGWLLLVDRAQSEPERIARFLATREAMLALTAADVQAMAQRYLDPAQAVEVLVLPEGVDVPTQGATPARTPAG